MNLKNVFKQKKPLFIPFMMAGFPTLPESIEALLALSEAGADIIELGVPFSDPIADGPINQYAAYQALQQNINLNDILNMVSIVRQKGYATPIIIFSYFNPILAYGINAFKQKALEVGVNGILIVDLPPEEGIDIYLELQQVGLEIILLISPTTDPKRYQLIKTLNPAFIYYISRLSVTGIQSYLSQSLQQEIRQLNNVFQDTPIAVGFGISSVEQAKEVSLYADGVIVGSFLVNALHKQGIVSFKQKAADLSKVITKAIKLENTE